jgi:hypothetical protein
MIKKNKREWKGVVGVEGGAVGSEYQSCQSSE